MSKNVIEASINCAERHSTTIGLIPSRRQVEYTGGYVCGFKTKEFVAFVRSRTEKVQIQRDHGGPLQGDRKDSGFKSFKCDINNGFDLLHIDPWKKYQRLDRGIEETINLIQFCEKNKYRGQYEIGTEEAIRLLEPAELALMIRRCEKVLPRYIFSKIKYIVVQGGTALKSNKNIGVFNEERFSAMINITRSHGMRAKEHNGDYLLERDILKRFELGLDAINIAPEFGFLETSIILNELFNEGDYQLYNLLYLECKKSKRWNKWIPENFNELPLEMRKQIIIRVAGHYVLNSSVVKEIKNKYDYLDDIIKEKLEEKIGGLLCLTEKF